MWTGHRHAETIKGQRSGLSCIYRRRQGLIRHKRQSVRCNSTPGRESVGVQSRPPPSLLISGGFLGSVFFCFGKFEDLSICGG